MRFTLLLPLLILTTSVFAHPVHQTKSGHQDKFRQMDEVWPTPTTYRTGSGAPGHEYWQQQADYKIRVAVDETTQILTGSETITYHNNAPDTLKYLWLQLDQNRFAKHSSAWATLTQASKESLGMNALRMMMIADKDELGHKILSVKGADGTDLPFVINDTVMRIDLPQPLRGGTAITFSIDWNYQIPEGKALSARGGWEYFEEDDNYLFFISQWFPRMVAYTDVDGWNTKGFLGRGEFTLEFGDYDVEITVPADHVVASTGILQNSDDVLSRTQINRLEKAANAKKPVFIVTKGEALKAQKKKSTDTKTWHFTAENVRDFAFATSRKFVWDAQGHKERDGRTVMAMSFYPEEGMPLWDKYSTEAILQTLDTYGRMTVPYPYPVAISVNGPIGGGMEYPMITSNGPRPEKDDTYSRRAKYGLIGVVIHEIGHNWFPMIVNSDERNWTWMDEGLNSFLQFIAEQEWEEDYPSRRGHAVDIIDYMISPNQVPIMTQSESILQFGNNAYGKPAIALNILRETVMGRENFDFAFREYAERWWYKRPQPADFFRTMEDASGIDLDWFWRGWFYTTDHVDISIDKVTLATINTKDPDVEAKWKRDQKAAEPRSITAQRNDGMTRRTDKDPSLLDFYNENDEFTVSPKDREAHDKLMKDMEPWEKELLALGTNLYFVDFSNHGGLVMPLLLQITYGDGTVENQKIPAEIWRTNQKNVTKLIVTDKTISAIALDPNRETADADEHNNYWPRKPVETRLELFKRKIEPNLMQKMKGGSKE